MAKVESDNDSDWDDTLPDLPEGDLWGAAVILEIKEKRHLIINIILHFNDWFLQ